MEHHLAGPACMPFAFTCAPREISLVHNQASESLFRSQSVIAIKELFHHFCLLFPTRATLTIQNATIALAIISMHKQRVGIWSAVYKSRDHHCRQITVLEIRSTGEEEEEDVSQWLICSNATTMATLLPLTSKLLYGHENGQRRLGTDPPPGLSHSLPQTPLRSTTTTTLEACLSPQ